MFLRRYLLLFGGYSIFGDDFIIPLISLVFLYESTLITIIIIGDDIFVDIDRL